eukprot:m.259086 g.259086  ORF g.259086 m.259086 type:complete len:467 (-) comp37564_c0_seq1:50-1450(-)
MADWSHRSQGSIPVMNQITVGRNTAAGSRNSQPKMSRFEEILHSLKRTPPIVLIVVGLFILLNLFYLFTGGSDDVAMGQGVYSVMIDAGSTGSRVHAYHFTRVNGGNPVLQSELFEQLKPGLSSFKDDPAGGANSLVPLIESAMKKVPSAYHKATPISVMATAGLRMLQDSQAEGLLESVRKLLSRFPFKYDREAGVSIMDGLSEAQYAWVTINYLRGSLDVASAKTAVMLDLGGGSTQIAMGLATGKGNLARSAGPDYKTITLMGYTHTLFLHSYLGFGLMAGRSAIFKLGDGVASACVPSGSTASFKYGDASWNVLSSSTSNEDGCFTAAKTALMGEGSEFASSVEKPQEGQPVYAMSYYFDRAVDANLISPEAEEGQLTPELYHQAAKQICRLTTSEIGDKYPNSKPDGRVFLCMDLCFISTLLTQGFGLKDTTPLHLAKAMRFNGERVETQWTLGAALQGIL